MAFYNSIDNSSNIVLAFTQNPQNDFGFFAKGYLNSASILAERFLNSPQHSDYMGYPILFLYRHAFELYLKSIIYKTIALAQLKNIEGIKAKLYNTHDLIVLADAVYMLIDKLYSADEFLITLGDRIREIASEFHEIDPISFAYRYPISKDGKHSTSRNQIVNIEAVHKTMTALLNEFDVIDFGLKVDILLEKEFIDELFQKN